MQQFSLMGVFKVPSQLENLNTTVSFLSRQQTNNWPQLRPSLPHGSLLPREEKKDQASPSHGSPSYHSPSDLKAGEVTTQLHPPCQ